MGHRDCWVLEVGHTSVQKGGSQRHGWLEACGQAFFALACSLAGRSCQDDGRGEEKKPNKLLSTLLVLHFIVVRYGNCTAVARRTRAPWRMFPGFKCSNPTVCPRPPTFRGTSVLMYLCNRHFYHCCCDEKSYGVRVEDSRSAPRVLLDPSPLVSRSRNNCRPWC